MDFQVLRQPHSSVTQHALSTYTPDTAVHALRPRSQHLAVPALGIDHMVSNAGSTLCNLQQAPVPQFPHFLDSIFQ